MALLDVGAQTHPEQPLIAQDALNITNKVRSNPLPWRGQFSPQLVQAFLRHYAAADSFVFDPFLGSGTVLLEAARAGLPAGGTEINPAAIALSQLYHFANTPRPQRDVWLDELNSLLLQSFPVLLPLFDRHRPDFSAAAVDLPARLATLRQTLTKRELVWLLDALITLLDFYKTDISAAKIHKSWRDLQTIVRKLPFSAHSISVFHADARRAPLPDSSVNLVITSPPYINVFNYHQQYRASMEALRWDLLQTAKSEFGANRKHRSNRFLTVIQYCLDMSQTFAELKRVCRPAARLIFVVGRESTVRGVKFRNGEIVTAVACHALGFSLHLRQERVFRNRFGVQIYEDILHFSPPATFAKDFLSTARQIAGSALADALNTAAENVQADIDAALSAVETVQPSPIFDPIQAIKRDE